MKGQKNTPAPARQALPAVSADPQVGLTAEQVSQRVSCGWRNLTCDSASRTEGEIIVQHILTFFNLVFVVLAVVLGVAMALTGKLNAVKPE